MANELTLSANLTYADAESAAVALAIAAKLANVTTKRYVYNKMNIAITDTVIGLGNITTLGWAIFVNRDATNTINLKTAAAGTIFASILPGECAFFRIGSGITAPNAIALVATCQLEYLLIST